MEKPPPPRLKPFISRFWPVAWILLAAMAGIVGRVEPASPGAAAAPKPRWTSASTLPDAEIESLLGQVVSSTVFLYDGGLSGEWPVIVGGQPYTIETRATGSGEPIEMATAYVGEQMAALGLEVNYHSWQSASYSGRNVVGEQEGFLFPDRIYVIGAHLDSRSPTPGDAPGADDNASGSTAVLIAADILSQYQWGCTVRYLFFTGEEQGLLGSSAYAAQMAGEGQDIRGVLNLDMIGWNSTEPDKAEPWMELHARLDDPRNLALAQLFIDVVGGYGLDLLPEISPTPTNRSDHASFWDYGYPAILAIEDFRGDFNPYYHSTEDVIGNLNDPGYFTDMVRAAVGTMIHLANCRQHHFFPMVAVEDQMPSPHDNPRAVK